MTDEPYYQYRQVSSDFFAGTDGILAGSGKFLPMAHRYFKGLVGFLFLYLKRLLCMGELSMPRRARPLRWRRRGVGNSTGLRRTTASGVFCKLKAIEAFRLLRNGDTPFLKPSPARQRKSDKEISPLSRFPQGGKAGVGGRPPRRQKRAAPPTRGFSKRFAENPLVIPQEHMTSCSEKISRWTCAPEPAKKARKAESRISGFREFRLYR